MRRMNLLKPRFSDVAASPVKRAFAFVLDMLVIDIVLFFPFRRLFSRMVPDLSLSSISSLIKNPEMTGFFISVAFSMGILSVLYFTLMEYRTCQTLGKMVMKITVKSTDGSLRLWQCFVRSLFLLPIMPFIILWAADVIYIFFNNGRQRLLEIVSRTRTTETIMEVL